MARVNSAQYYEKWARRLKGASTDIRNGVERVSEAPGQSAARSADKLLQNFTAAVNSGKWQRNVAAVSLEDWKRATLEKGINRIAAGVDSAESKVLRSADKLLADVDAVKSEVDRMPNVSLEDNIARMTAWARGMHQRSQG